MRSFKICFTLSISYFRILNQKAFEEKLNYLVVPNVKRLSLYTEVLTNE